MFCVYCSTLYGIDTFVCPTCNEYDGMMSVAQAESYLGEDLGEYA